MSVPVPFPVEDTYRMRADLRKLDGSPFLFDEEAPRYADAKLALLKRAPERVRVVDPAYEEAERTRDARALVDAVTRLRADVVCGRSDAVDFVDGAFVLDGYAFPRLSAGARRHLESVPEPARLVDALALSLQEDLVWMRDDGGGGRATLLHVCFPSHWNPSARAGASLTDLHGPVADASRVRAASAPLMSAITRKGPFVRHVWSLEPVPELDRHPDAVRHDRPGDAEAALERLWFRVERQTTWPFPERSAALFLIRVMVAPLTAVLAEEPDRARRLARSVRSMTPAVLRYKRLDRRRDGLLASLDAFDARWGHERADGVRLPSPEAEGEATAS